MAYNTVILKKFGNPIRIERAPGGTITPGHLVKINSSDQLVVHSTAAGRMSPMMVAVEDELQGNGITDTYTVSNGGRVQAEVLRPGDEFYGILTTSQTISIGDLLESTGDGTLREMALSSVDDPQLPCAMAVEAVTTTSAVARIKAMVI
jgi:hypothetical protein